MQQLETVIFFEVSTVQGVSWELTHSGCMGPNI